MAPTVTLVVPVKLVPVIVIAVPPLKIPEFGTTLEIVGELETYVNAPTLVALPPGVVTTTFFTPAVAAPVSAVTEVALTTATLVAATPPTVTLLVPVKLVPVIVMAVPPSGSPVDGLTTSMVGSPT